MALVPRVVALNWRLKIAAFGLTVFLWALVRAAPSRQADVFAVPVRAQVGDLNWTLAGDPSPATVQVSFRGPPDDLIRLAREGTSLRIQLDSVSAADTVVQLRRDWVVLGSGSGLVVEDIEPASVRLVLQPTLSTLLPLRVRTTGQLRAGLALAAPVGLDPQVVRLRGAARRVRELDSVPLEPLDLGDVEASGVYTVSVDTTGLGDLTLTPGIARLGIRLEPVMERELTSVPVVAGTTGEGSQPDSLVMVPATIAVRLEGARTPVTGTRLEDVQAVVPEEALAGLEPGQERRVPIQLRGVPPLVRGFAAVDSVTVRR